jgi:aspartate/methionine/tyrosine aminotransferase
VNHDLAFAKTHVEGEYNLAIGEPIVLQQLLRASGAIQPPNIAVSDLQYPALGGHPRLIDELTKLYPGQHAVVANGGKQALTAALYGFSETERSSKYTTRRTRVYAQAPCWPSFETCAQAARMSYESRQEPLHEPGVLRIITAPGNPSGWEWEDAEHADIWDAAYAQRTYGWWYEDGQAPFTYEVKVESASKMFGMSGLRVGWLVTRNEQLARHAAEYVESSTSGVSHVSQLIIADLLSARSMLKPEFDTARLMMLQNLRALRAVIEPHVVDTDYADLLGMFAWFQVAPEARERVRCGLVESRVRMLPGHLFGAHPNEGWYRCSLGSNPVQFLRAMEALKRALG